MNPEVYALMLDGSPLSCQDPGQAMLLMLFTDRQKVEHAYRVFGPLTPLEIETIESVERLIEVIEAGERNGAVSAAWNLVVPTQPGPPICDGVEPLTDLKRRILPHGES